eukprot:CAMPEP_0119341490 /NCGR_PEP_ID=MMETSP1333-20130426/102544_1 /TAXON_ID=418940 /ORGANISM="Scyphosphaera apsteinii, Strain RCC1455" /LENGTH=315 /DNA_ID=CAMNT_0007353471 /DNA_START=79 /DNA_END=1023 /DNA_ORIENTATION=+
MRLKMRQQSRLTCIQQFTDPSETFVDILVHRSEEEELATALHAVQAIPTDELCTRNFILGPALAARMDAVRYQIVNGPGLAILRLPKSYCAQAGEETVTRAFVGLCTHLGCMIPQSKDLMERVARVETPRDHHIIASPNTTRRGYRNSKEQIVHCDASIPAARGCGQTDILAMLCIRPSSDGGGVSRLTSAEALYAALQATQPTHVTRLARGFRYDAQIEWLPHWRQPQTSTVEVPILWRDKHGRACVQYGVNLRANLEAAYGGRDEIDKAGVAALDALNETANSRACRHTLRLEAGWALICDNYRWMHGREEFL